MRKQTKLVAVLSAAALLAIGASMTSFAATPHWADQDGAWVFLDSDGERVTNEWEKSNNAWYYLDDNGEMAIDMWVDSDYYVGTDGKMIVNNWAKLTPEDGGDTDPDGETEHWFYFDSKGKKANNEKKTLNGKVYIFDADGYMEHGWYQDDNNDIYYLGDEDDGARKTGFMWLEADTGEDGVDADCAVCDNEGWYLFETSGKMYKSTKAKSFNGKKYYFNDHGQMLYNWIITATAGNTINEKDNDDKMATPSLVPALAYSFDVEKGSRVNGWLKVDGSYTAGTEGDNDWYNFKDGAPRRATNGLSVTVDADARYREIISIDGKKFCFNEKGKMSTGIQAVPSNSITSIDGYDTYYFDESGNMKTGKVSNVSQDNGETGTYFFQSSGSNKGKGFTGEKDGYLYYQGKRLEADSDYKFYNVLGNDYLVNKSGKIQVYNKGFAATDKFTGKKLDAGKLENGNDGSYGNLEYVYLFTDNKGVVAAVMDSTVLTATATTPARSDIYDASTTPVWGEVPDKADLGWED